ncbi:phosphoglycolate phosphatase [Shimia sp. NS0008-38b]
MIKAVVFDLDGTLVDSAPDIQTSVNKMLAEEGKTQLDLPTVVSFVGNGLPKLVERVMHVRDIPGTEFERLSARLLAIYGASSSEGTSVFEGVVDVLGKLRTRGFDLGVCTNKPEQPARRVLKAKGLIDHFSTIVGGDSLSVRKPDPLPLQTVMADLAPNEVLYVGDSEIDAETATNAGVKFALFTEGYRKSPVTQIEHDVRFSSWEDFLSLAELCDT